MDIEHLDTEASRDRFSEIEAVCTEAFPHYSLADYRARMQRLFALPRFEAVTVRHEGALVGVCYGAPLAAGSQWWDGLDPAPPTGFTTETGKRTFAVIDLAVRPAYRGQGLARRLLDDLLTGRAEERATLAAAPDEHRIQAMYRRWGWQHVGRVPGSPGETEDWFDLYVIALRSTSEDSSSA